MEAGAGYVAITSKPMYATPPYDIEYGSVRAAWKQTDKTVRPISTAPKSHYTKTEADDDDDDKSDCAKGDGFN